jgi:hypothetical protein
MSLISKGLLLLFLIVSAFLSCHYRIGVLIVVSLQFNVIDSQCVWSNYRLMCWRSNFAEFDPSVNDKCKVSGLALVRHHAGAELSVFIPHLLNRIVPLLMLSAEKKQSRFQV